METSVERTGVDVEGLLETLAESLYSTAHVVVRELVQNAHDSCTRRRVEGDPVTPRIRVGVEPAARQLWVEDNGAGLTREEIGTYLATIGRGYTRVLRKQGATDDLIGYFGLGFLSAYVVSEKTEVWTCSRSAPERAWLFSTRSGNTYTVIPAETRPVGTRVTLTLSDRHATLARPEVLADVLARYTCLLDVPVSFCQPGVEPRLINDLDVPWLLPDDAPRAARRRVEHALAERFEPSYRVLETLPVRHEEDGLQVRGLLWIQDGWSYGSADNRHVSVFVRGMLVGGRERELLPAWASFVGAVVECPQLNPTTSRESLREDDAFRRVAEVLRVQLIDGLARLRGRAPQSWSRMLRRHNEALLGAAVAEPALFDALQDGLTLPTSEGDVPAPEVFERGGGSVFASQQEGNGFAELLLRATRRPVLHGYRYGALAFARRYAEARGGRLVVVGSRAGDRALFSRVDVAAETHDALSAMFGHLGHTLVLSHFEPAWLPLVLVPDQDAELKQRLETDEAEARISAGVLRLARAFTETIEATAPVKLYVNVDAPVIRALLAAADAVRASALELLLPAAELWSHGYSEKADFEGSLRRLNDRIARLVTEG